MRSIGAAGLGLIALMASGTTFAGEENEESEGAAARGQRFEVTVTNLTRGQQFTPILVASHREGLTLFTEGSPASRELATLAEEGDTGPLMAQLRGRRDVREVVTSPGLLNPGATATIVVAAGGPFDHLSVAAMLIPTNDTFFSLNGVEGPKGRQVLTLYSPAYDAGSEVNDELCSSIPGPFFAECGGPGGGGHPLEGQEGYVHISAGIHGIGDLCASQRDWRNPVAKLTVRRLR